MEPESLVAGAAVTPGDPQPWGPVQRLQWAADASGDARLTATARQLLPVIAVHANSRTGALWTAHATLARESAMSVRSVGDGMRDLASRGWIVRTSEPWSEKHRRPTPLYCLAVPQIARQLGHHPRQKPADPPRQKPADTLGRKLPRRSAEKRRTPGRNLPTNQEEPGRNQPAASARARAEADPRLAAAAAAGAYLTYRDEDLRADWLAELGDVTPDRITAILASERLPDGRKIRLPSGFAVARQAVDVRERQARERAARAERAAAAVAELDREAAGRNAIAAERAAVAAHERQRAELAAQQRQAEQDAQIAAAEIDSRRRAEALLRMIDTGALPLPEPAIVIVQRLREDLEQGSPHGVLGVRIDAVLHHLPSLRLTVAEAAP